MNFLTKLWDDTKGIFASLTPGMRMITVILAVAVVVGLFFLFRFEVSSSNEYLLAGRALSPSEVQAAEAAFAKASLKDYEIMGGRIRIPSSKRDLYVAALAEGNALPPDFNTYFDEAIANGNMFESRQQREARIKYTTEKQLGFIISKMNGIESAAVRYDQRTEGGFPAKNIVTAMVAVKAVGDNELPRSRTQSIKYLVSSSIAGLDPKEVSVTDLNTGVTSPGVGKDGDNTTAEDNIYLTFKEMHEKDYTANIERALSYVKGAIVSVHVELKEEMDSASWVESYPNPKTIALETTEDTRSLDSTRSEGGGRPGLAAQAATANGASSVASRASNRTTEEISSISTKSTVGRDITYSKKASLTPKWVTVSISIPESYLVKIWQQKNPPAEGEEPKRPDDATLTVIENEENKRIQDAVNNLLPQVQAGAEPYPRIQVTTFPDLPVTPIPEKSTTASAMGWFGSHWQMLAMSVASLFGLIVLRNMVKTSIAKDREALHNATEEMASFAREATSRQDAEGEEGEGGGDKAANPRDLLSQMVRSDPDTAAGILRGWIDNAN